MENTQLMLDEFGINESHNKWTKEDDSNAVTLFELMNNRLPKENDIVAESAIVFLSNATKFSLNEWMQRSDYGSIYLTAKRIVYKHLKTKSNDKETKN